MDLRTCATPDRANPVAVVARAADAVRTFSWTIIFNIFEPLSGMSSHSKQYQPWLAIALDPFMRHATGASSPKGLHCTYLESWLEQKHREYRYCAAIMIRSHQKLTISSSDQSSSLWRATYLFPPPNQLNKLIESLRTDAHLHGQSLTDRCRMWTDFLSHALAHNLPRSTQYHVLVFFVIWAQSRNVTPLWGYDNTRWICS